MDLLLERGRRVVPIHRFENLVEDVVAGREFSDRSADHQTAANEHDLTPRNYRRSTHESRSSLTGLTANIDDPMPTNSEPAAFGAQKAGRSDVTQEAFIAVST